MHDRALAHPCSADPEPFKHSAQPHCHPAAYPWTRRLKLANPCTNATTFLGEPRAGQTNHDQCIAGELSHRRQGSSAHTRVAQACHSGPQLRSARAHAPLALRAQSSPSHRFSSLPCWRHPSERLPLLAQRGCAPAGQRPPDGHWPDSPWHPGAAGGLLLCQPCLPGLHALAPGVAQPS